MKEKGFNLRIVDVKDEIVQVLNNSGLPIMVLQMTLQEIIEQVRLQSAAVLKAERTEFNTQAVEAPAGEVKMQISNT